MLTATEIAAAVRSGDLDPVEVVREALLRISSEGGALGAFQVVRGEKAVAEALSLSQRSDLSTLPLAGVPIAIKDNIPVAGEPMRDGSQATSAVPQTTDHVLVRRLREAGAIVVGITAVPELCVFGATDSAFGITRNPWDTRYTPGGSSGGSAAAVAAGLVPIAHGNDGMGSIRIPSANCGLFGLKPGAGVVPQDIGIDAWFGMSENGPLATTVADAALMLSVMSGRTFEAVEPATPLRIAIAAKPSSPLAKLDPEWARGLAETAAALKAEGHTVTEVDFPYKTGTIPLLARWTAGTATDADGLDAAKLEPRIRTHARIGRLLRGQVKQKHVDAQVTAAESFFADFDLLITPTLAQSAPEAIEWSKKSWLANMIANVSYAPYPSVWNFVGWPAASVPAGFHAQNTRPLAVQLVTPPGGEALIISVATQLERVRPWPRTAPAA